MVRTQILELGENLSVAAQHMSLYCENRHWDLRCQALPGRELARLKEWLPFVETQAVALRLPVSQSPDVLQTFPHLPAVVSWLESADVLMHENQEWWPRLIAYESLRKLVIHQCPELDIAAEAFVIGTGRLARVAVTALANLGFSRLRWVSEDMKVLNSEAEYISRFLLGLQIQKVEAHQLTMQEPTGSLLVNTVNHPDDSTVLADLSYFNFMFPGGVVVDLSEVTLTNTLLEEARQANLSTVSGAQAQSQWDLDFLKMLLPSQYITFEDYSESLADFLGSSSQVK